MIAIALKHIAQNTLPFAKRWIAQIVTELHPPTAQQRCLLAFQVASQLRQHHQGEELDGDLGGLKNALELLGIVIEYSKGFFVGMGKGKGVLLTDEVIQVKMHCCMCLCTLLWRVCDAMAHCMDCLPAR